MTKQQGQYDDDVEDMASDIEAAIAAFFSKMDRPEPSRSQVAADALRVVLSDIETQLAEEYGL